jgi:glutamyl-tRNA synthetase
VLSLYDHRYVQGTENDIVTRDELIEAFALQYEVKSPSVFDVEKLKWVNRQHLNRMSINEVIPYVIGQIFIEDIVRDGTKRQDRAVYDFALAATAIAKKKMSTTEDAVSNVLRYYLPRSFDELPYILKYLSMLGIRANKSESKACFVLND